MTTENEGLYTSIDTGKTGDEKQQNDNSDNPNNDMETLPVGEGVHAGRAGRDRGRGVAQAGG